MQKEDLMKLARQAALKAYAPYSQFRVGAALLTDSGEVLTGVNVENRSFGLTNCAERTAIFAAIARGFKDFTAIAIAGPDSKLPLPPCGACRQVISEFGRPDMIVYYDDGKGGMIVSSIQQLLPADSLHTLGSRSV